MLRAPESRMDILTTSEIDEINSKSQLVRKYSEVLDRESAYEILNKKISEMETAAAQKQLIEENAKPTKSSTATSTSQTKKSIIKVLTSATFIRGFFGVMSKLMKGK